MAVAGTTQVSTISIFTTMSFGKKSSANLREILRRIHRSHLHPPASVHPLEVFEGVSFEDLVEPEDTTLRSEGKLGASAAWSVQLTQLSPMMQRTTWTESYQHQCLLQRAAESPTFQTAPTERSVTKL